MIIYKITNKKDGKIYIGLTTRTLEDRWKQHKWAVGKCNRRLYLAMEQDGIDNFTIEQIDEATSLQDLGLLEMVYIKKFKSQDPNIGYNISAGGETSEYESNPKARVTLEEVIQIRNIYAMCDLRCKECWEIYKNKISFSAFQKIWEGQTWKGIASEVYSEENKNFHKNQLSNPGDLNGNSVFTNEEVFQARLYYTTHSLKDTFNKFGSKFKSINGFRSMLTRSYSNVPKYSKIKKQWFLENKPFDINNYNPVSTILGPEE